MWQVFMDRLCRAAGISCGYLIGHGGESGVLLAGGGTNFAPEMFQLYNDYYAARDPYAEPLLREPRLGLVQGDELYDRAQLLKSEIYNDLLRKYELESTSVLVCSWSQKEIEALSLWRGPNQGSLEPGSKRLLESLLPHLQTALQLRAKILSHDDMRVFSEMALDAIPIGALLVNSDCTIRHANGRAKALLDEGDALMIARGKLAVRDGENGEELERLVRAAATGELTKGLAAPRGALRLVRPKTGRFLQVTVVPVPRRNNIAGAGHAALVFVSDPNEVSASRAGLMRQLYRLTPTESRLADYILEGLEVREAAERLRITFETARFHLKRVLAKTGTRRQTELIRLMLSLPCVPAGGEDKAKP